MSYNKSLLAEGCNEILKVRRQASCRIWSEQKNFLDAILPPNFCDAIGSEISKIVIKSDVKIAASIVFSGRQLCREANPQPKIFRRCKNEYGNHAV